MASFIDKLRINTAVDTRTQMSFLTRHQTTAGFMEFGIAHITELLPKQPYKVKHSSFVRLEPMPIPTNGSIKINNRAFFVPYRTVWSPFNDFYTDVKGVSSTGVPQSYANAPTIADNIFIDFFDDIAQSTAVVEGSIPDFVIIGSDGTESKRKFTRRGKHYYKILRQLGYSIDFNQQNTPFNHCALSLLCAAKVSYDWYSVTAYAFDVRYTKVQSIFERKSSYSLTKTDLSDLLYILESVHYDSDYFTSAWDNPYGPNTGGASAYTLRDITQDGINSNGQTPSVVMANSGSWSNDAPQLYATGNNDVANANYPGRLTGISQYALQALKSLTDFLQRNKIAGARTLDRYLARWNVKLSNDKLNRSYYISSKRESVLIGDVTSTSDTSGANLGAFAGKGIGYNEYTFDYSNDDELGLFFVFSTIVPEVSYYQGESALNMRITRTQFYQPEFDNLGVQAINKRELYCPLDGNLTRGISNWDSQVFGFTPRYADYKVQLDKVTGDYVVPSLSTGKDSWYIGRDMRRFVDEESPTPMDNLAHSIIFTEGTDATQYNRIFYNTSSEVDNFNVSHVFDVTTTFPGKSLFNTYEFDDKGETVSIDVNGVKVN